LITGAIATTDPAAGALVFDNAGQLSSAYIGADPSTLPALANITFPPSTVTLPSMANGAKLNSTFDWKLLAANNITPNISGLRARAKYRQHSKWNRRRLFEQPFDRPRWNAFSGYSAMKDF
jgi:hypothetical protein